MIFVIPVFKDVFKSFGADLPAPTQLVHRHVGLLRRAGGGWRSAVIGGSDLRLDHAGQALGHDPLRVRPPDPQAPGLRRHPARRRSRAGAARSSTMFAAGVPLVESLDSVAGAAGNAVYTSATKRIQTEVSTGTSLTNAMRNTHVFPNMVLQMVQIGEESGSLDAMLSKVADFFEREVDDAVAALVLAARADHHGVPRRRHRRPRGRDVPADLQAGRGRLTPGRDPAERWRSLLDPAVALSRGRRDRPVRRELPQRRHPPPAEDDGARLGRAVRGARRPRARRRSRATTSSSRARLPGVRAPDHRARERPGASRGWRCAAAARPAARAISARYPLVELRGRRRRRSPRSASSARPGGPRGLRIPVDAARAHVHRPRHAAAARRHHAAAAVGRAAREPVRPVRAAAPRRSSAPSPATSSLWIVYWLFKLIRGKEGMGYGDFKLLAALGAWLGWKMLPRSCWCRRVLGAVGGIAAMALRKRDGAAAAAVRALPRRRRRGRAVLRAPLINAALPAGERCVVGLTGGIGSGKSTVAAAFAALGAPVVDADAIAHELSAPGGAGHDAVVAAFGPLGARRATAALDRGAMRERAFADPAFRAPARGGAAPADPRRDRPAHRAAGARPTASWSCRCSSSAAATRSRVDRVLVVDCPEDEQVAARRAAQRPRRRRRCARSWRPSCRAPSASRAPTTSSTTAGRARRSPPQVRAPRRRVPRARGGRRRCPALIRAPIRGQWRLTDLTDVIRYEHPLNERIRTLMRLEDLFARVARTSTSAATSRRTITRRSSSLFEIADVAARADLKTDLLQELERQRQLLVPLRENPRIEAEALDALLADIDAVDGAAARPVGQARRAPARERVADGDQAAQRHPRRRVASSTCPPTTAGCTATPTSRRARPRRLDRPVRADARRRSRSCCGCCARTAARAATSRYHGVFQLMLTTTKVAQLLRLTLARDLAVRARDQRQQVRAQHPLHRRLGLDRGSVYDRRRRVRARVLQPLTP